VFLMMDYLIYEYNCKDTIFGSLFINILLKERYVKINLSYIKSNESMKLDFSW
jgi:hypothetical protein